MLFLMMCTVLMAQNNNQRSNENENISFSDIYKIFLNTNYDLKVEFIKLVPDKEIREKLAKEYSKIQAKKLACNTLDEFFPGLGAVAEMVYNIYNS